VEAKKAALTATETEQTLYYDKLNYIPVEQKDKVWAARWLYYAKTHAQDFVDPVFAEKIRKRVKGEVDEAKHRKMIDPVDAKAEFFHADFKACPIDQHLDEIVEATVKQIPVNLGVKAVDEYSISNREKNNRNILKKGLLINLINAFNKQLGFPLLKPSDDPFKYIQNMQALAQQQGQQPAAAVPKKKAKGSFNQQAVSNEVIQSLVSQIDSDELLGIYNQFLHKEGVEIACELGIDYYLNVKNKFVFKHASNVINDIKAFNKCCGRLYTSEVSGTPVFQYLRPDRVKISTYSERDLSDHTFWLYEEEVTYSQFTRMFGAELTQDELIRVFELNRKYNGDMPTFHDCNVFVRGNAMIRIGYMEFESQDMEVYADYTTKEGNPVYKKMPSDFVPGYKKTKSGGLKKVDGVEQSSRDEVHYNCWYKCYFIPYYMIDNSNASMDFKEQSQYIFGFGKLQDQERYGDDEQFARSSLMGFYSDKMTWFEIKDRFVDKIDHLWFLFQNDMANIAPHGLNWTYDLIMQMMGTVDDANKENKNAVAEWAAKVKQTGTAITKLLKDAQGNVLPNQPEPFREIKTGHLEAALGKLDAIMILYNLMVKALGQNEFSEGAAPKPRTNLGSIQLALGASGKATFYIEEAYTDFLCSIGNKMLKYFKDLVDEGDSERMREFEDLVGQANATAVKEIKDIPMRNLGLFVTNVMTKDQKEMLMQLAQSMASAGTLDEQTALFLTFTENLKQAYAILVFKKAQMDKQQAAAEQQKQQWAMDLLDKQTQLEVTKIQAQGQVKMQLEQMIGQIQAKLEETVINLKGHWTMMGKEQIKNNRIEQDITNSNIQKLNSPEGDHLPERRNMPIAS
jgi:hypothetical protein